jgi:hypothetical protein
MSLRITVAHGVRGERVYVGVKTTDTLASLPS